MNVPMQESHLGQYFICIHIFMSMNKYLGHGELLSKLVDVWHTFKQKYKVNIIYLHAEN